MPHVKERAHTPLVLQIPPHFSSAPRLSFALAVILDACRAARVAAAEVTITAVLAAATAAMVFFVSFITCVVVMLWSSVRSEWFWRRCWCPAEAASCSYLEATALSFFTGRTLSHVWASVGPCGALWGCMVLLYDVWYGVLCGRVWCVSTPNFERSCLARFYFFFQKKKRVLCAGPIRPNALSISKSISAKVPVKPNFEVARKAFFCPYFRRISVEKKWSWVAVSSST